jgi:exodeoxyribonuclease-5
VVFIDMGYLPEGKADVDFVRWLYTALTRASVRVYLLGFDDKLFA